MEKKQIVLTGMSVALHSRAKAEGALRGESLVRVYERALESYFNKEESKNAQIS